MFDMKGLFDGVSQIITMLVPMSFSLPGSYQFKHNHLSVFHILILFKIIFEKWYPQNFF
jgi:hypothetical protein